jgi:hypothetical protein
MADWRSYWASIDERARKAHAEEVARGEHDEQCEYLAIPGFYLCHCHKRARLARGLTEPPELEWQYPTCTGCWNEVEGDADGFNCRGCGTSWSHDGAGHFHDDYGDLQASLARCPDD